MEEIKRPKKLVLLSALLHRSGNSPAECVPEKGLKDILGIKARRHAWWEWALSRLGLRAREASTEMGFLIATSLITSPKGSTGGSTQP